MTESDAQYTDDEGRTWRWRLYDFTEEPRLFAVAYDQAGNELTDELVQVDPPDVEQNVENLKAAALRFEADYPSAPHEVRVRAYLTLQEFRLATAHLPGDVPMVIAGQRDEWFNASLDPAGVPEEWPSPDTKYLKIEAVDNFDEDQL